MITDVRFRTVAPWVALSLLVPACDAAAPDEMGGIAESTYVNALSHLADLQRFPPPGTDSTARRLRADSIRQAILDRYAVTAEELIGFAERVGPKPGRMESISEQIVARTDSLAQARADARPDSVSADSAVNSAAVSKSISDSVGTRGGARLPARAEPIPIRGEDGELLNPRRLPSRDRPPRE